MLTLGQAGLGAGGRNTLIHHFRMTQSRNLLLGHEDFTADIAVLTLGQAGLGAGGLHSLIHHFCMTQGGNLLLGNEDFTAGAAVLTLGQAAGGAGRRHGLVNDLGMGEHIRCVFANLLLCPVHIKGGYIFGIALFGAGGFPVFRQYGSNRFYIFHSAAVSAVPICRDGVAGTVILP